MRRDMDLIRELLFKLEALDVRPGGILHINFDDEEIQIHSYTPDDIQYHVRLLIEAGLIEPGKRAMQGLMFRFKHGRDASHLTAEDEIYAAGCAIVGENYF